MDILICTTNKGKAKEFKDSLLNAEIKILSDENIYIDIEENGNTFRENALIKLNEVLKLYPKLKQNYDLILAEDSGLCVDSLNGAPGIFSARYAGLEKSDKKNNLKLLDSLNGISDRKAHYAICMAVYYKDKIITIEDSLGGKIATNESGENGFGYDSLFIPEGYDITFGELEETIKNKISHRAKAITKLLQYIKENK